MEPQNDNRLDEETLAERLQFLDDADEDGLDAVLTALLAEAYPTCEIQNS